MIGKFNGEAGQAQSYVDHGLWFNGRALSEEELGIVWNDHTGLSFDSLISDGDDRYWYWGTRRRRRRTAQGLILP
jgi:hypothetical protein